MTTTNTCRAQDPISCRFHGPTIRMDTAIANHDFSAFMEAQFDLQRALKSGGPNDLATGYKRPLFEETSPLPKNLGKEYAKAVGLQHAAITNDLVDNNYRAAAKKIKRIKQGNATIAKTLRGVVSPSDPAFAHINAAADALAQKVKTRSAFATDANLQGILKAANEIGSRD